MSENNLSSFDLDKYNLSQEELKILASVMEEVVGTGKSDTLDSLWEADYDDMPVDIYTFLSDPQYLGKSLRKDDGTDDLVIYKYWLNALNEIFEPNSGILEVPLSGAIGLGKSTIAVIGLAYVLHKLLCLKNPASFYRLVKGSKIGIALFNLNLDQSYGVGYYKLQSLLLKSPWFLERGTVSGIKNKTYYPGKDIEIVVGSKMEHFIGRDIFAGFLDEMDFAPGADVKVEQSKIMKLYTTVKRRMESRFMKLGTMPGILFLVSSKRSRDDFLEKYIQRNKNKPNIYIVDEPIWVVKADQGNYCGKTFNLAIGNNYNKSKILSDNEDTELYESRGQQVLKVPIEHKEAFELDIDSALNDIAGIAVSSKSKFILLEKLQLCYREYLKNPFTMEEVVLGFDDNTELKDFLNEKLLPKLNRDKPHFIHWDTSKTGDYTGLAMTTIASTKKVKRLSQGKIQDANDIVHKVVFAVDIVPEAGSEIPFYKIRNFIYYIIDVLGFNVAAISCDSFQSVDTIQQFKLRGLNAFTLSVDRSRTPYDTVKNAIYEGRYISPRIEVAEREFINLDDDKIRGRIDHPVEGSKDMSDAITGCVTNAMNYKKLQEGQVNESEIDAFVDINSSQADDFANMDINSWL